MVPPLLFSFHVNADSDFSVNAPNGYQAYNSPAADADRKNAVFFIRAVMFPRYFVLEWRYGAQVLEI